jgi:hypothetical protein
MIGAHGDVDESCLKVPPDNGPSFARKSLTMALGPR